MRNEIIRAACLHVLTSVCAFFLKRGLRYTDFSSLLKTALVAAASGESSRISQNFSARQLADSTGLPRSAVAKALQTKVRQEPLAEDVVPSGLLLKLWHNDAKYLDDNGAPRELLVSDRQDSLSGPVFGELCRDAGCEVPMDEVLQELLTLKHVAVSDGFVAARKRSHIISDEEEATRYAGFAISNFVSTLDHNTSGANNSKMFERTMVATDVNEASFKRFSEMVAETSVPFLEVLDDWVTAKATKRNPPEAVERRHVAGVGIYVFSRSSSEQAESEGVNEESG